MLIGIDFDNTIVSYDAIFHREAVARALVSADVPATKDAVRNHLRACGREDDWTLLQGHVYGSAIREAAPFAGALEFFNNCRQHKIALCIISHRTKHPVLGPQFDLHQAAFDWLRAHGVIDTTTAPLARDRAFFEETKQLKLDRIKSLGCTHFIDDLPEFLSEPGFPPGVARILFDPNNGPHRAAETKRVGSWSELADLFAPISNPSRR